MSLFCSPRGVEERETFERKSNLAARWYFQFRVSGACVNSLFISTRGPPKKYISQLLDQPEAPVPVRSPSGSTCLELGINPAPPSPHWSATFAGDERRRLKVFPRSVVPRISKPKSALAILWRLGHPNWHVCQLVTARRTWSWRDVRQTAAATELNLTGVAASFWWTCCCMNLISARLCENDPGMHYLVLNDWDVPESYVTATVVKVWM